MVRTEREMVGIYGPVILTSQPAMRGFIYKYLLGLTPILLTGLSLLALPCLQDIVNGFSPSLVNSLKMVAPELPQYFQIGVLLVAPVAIFLFFIFLGDVIHRPEIWIGAGLTLILSGAGAVVMVQGTGHPILSTGYILAFFNWVAYLVQPFCFVAAVGIIAGIEAFRRSLHYTLTRDVIIITGGIWNQVENVIPLHQVERIGLVQGQLGNLMNFGTIVAAGKVFGLSETDISGHHEQDELLHPDTDKVITVNWQQGSYNPLLCLYGVSDPYDVKARIENAIQKTSKKET